MTSDGSKKTVEAKLTRDAALDEAIAAMLREGLDDFATSAASFRESCGSEEVHQLRVALRRLRALLSLLAPRTGSPELSQAADRARALATAMGPTRDWDVLAENLDAASKVSEERVFGPLTQAVEARRAAAREAARAAFLAPSTKEFEEDLRLYLAREGWRDRTAKLRTRGSARRFAKKALRRLRRRAVRLAKHITRHSPERLHKARIAVKKIRYAAESFMPLFDERAARAYLRGLANVQDRLGAVNDAATAARLLSELLGDEPTPEMLRAAEALRTHIRQPKNLAQGKLKSCARRLRRKPFWS